MDELTSGKEEALAAAMAGATQRIAMALLEFPKKNGRPDTLWSEGAWRGVGGMRHPRCPGADA
jgi:hypothetical protein